MIPDIERRRSAPAEPPALRLLIVEDSAEYRSWLAALTARLGFEVITAEDGMDALDRLAEQPFDVAIVDHGMPRMSGLELIAHIRANPDLAGVYAVMLTAHEDIDMKLAALANGYDDFLTKSSPEVEISAKLVAARRVATRQRTLDVTARELYGLANRDELTGLFNRRFFTSHTVELLQEKTVSIILFDLDGFKAINDTYGHVAGDRVLRDVGALFHRSTRPEDVIARYGGDEFVMVIPDLPVIDVQAMATRLSADVRSLRWQAGDESFGIGVTPGVASSQSPQGATVEQLLVIADRDLYGEKWMRKHPGRTAESDGCPRSDFQVNLLESRERTPRAVDPGPARPQMKTARTKTPAIEPGTA